jgi:N-acetylmuramoyl-L-alanine amidase
MPLLCRILASVPRKGKKCTTKSGGLLDKNPPTQFASGLLLKTNAPACLAETVFLSNPYEQAALADTSSSGRRQQIAQNLFNGLLAWYNR